MLHRIMKYYEVKQSDFFFKKAPKKIMLKSSHVYPWPLSHSKSSVPTYKLWANGREYILFPLALCTAWMCHTKVTWQITCRVEMDHLLFPKCSPDFHTSRPQLTSFLCLQHPLTRPAPILPLLNLKPILKDPTKCQFFFWMLIDQQSLQIPLHS